MVSTQIKEKSKRRTSASKSSIRRDR